MAAVSILARLALIAALLGPSLRDTAVLKDARFRRGLQIVDGVIIRLIGIAQLVAFLYVLFFPYGIGFYPPVLAFNLAGAVGAVLLLLGKQSGRIVLLIWYALLLMMVVYNGVAQPLHTEVAIVTSAALTCGAYLGVSLWALPR